MIYILLPPLSDCLCLLSDSD